MAGAGFKTFNTGDVLTASDVNTYLMQQTTMVFADASARSTALGANVAEGMISYLKDTNATEVYDGSSWVSIGASGDITGVTAGTGITGGGTTGTVTITNDMATKIDAKGDLIVGTGADTYDRLAVGGTNGHVLTVDSTAATGMKWAAAAAGGKVLQVVSATYGTQTANATTTYADTNLTATITPTSATSKILVLVSQNGLAKSNAAGLSAAGGLLQLLRDSTVLSVFQVDYAYNGVTQANSVGGASTCYLDSPATTSATTYKTQFKAGAAASSVFVQESGSVSMITLMEIGA